MTLRGKLPFLRFDEVYHLGSLNSDQKGANFSTSYEGKCLSVSLCPVAWEMIAKLGGSVLHTLRYEGALYLDIRSITAATKRDMLVWAQEQGYAEISKKWRLREWDIEAEEWRWSDFDSADEARTELEYCEQGSIKTVRLHTLTEDGARLSGGRYGDEAFDMICLLHLEEVMMPAFENIVGAWWRDHYAPELLSAPRGGILPSRVQDFSSSESKTIHDVEDQTSFLSTDRFLLEIPVTSRYSVKSNDL